MLKVIKKKPYKIDGKNLLKNFSGQSVCLKNFKRKFKETAKAIEKLAKI